MPPEPTKPIEPEVTPESTVEPVVSEPVIISEPVIEPVSEPVVETPISDPVFSHPAKGESEGVIVEVPVVVPTESTPEPIVEAPVSEPVTIEVPASEPITPPASSHLPLAGEENSGTIVSSPPAKGEMPEAEGVKIEAPLTLPPSAPSLRREGEIPLAEQKISEPVVSSPSAPTPTPEPKLDFFHINMARARELLVKARYAVQLNKKKKMDKIMGLFLKKTKITNREVRDLLRLSHGTVNVYMNVLIKEGKIKREGKSTNTHYTKV